MIGPADAELRVFAAKLTFKPGGHIVRRGRLRKFARLLMFRRVINLACLHRERLLSLALLPVFLWGTMPRTACICADGHREAFCRAAVCSAVDGGRTTSACCGCSCCGKDSSPNSKNGSQAKSCCAAKQKTTRPSGVAARNSCCQPFIESSVLAVAVKKIDSATQLQVAATTPLVALNGADGIGPTLQRGSFCTPPPLDVVIVFQHLTI